MIVRSYDFRLLNMAVQRGSITVEEYRDISGNKYVTLRKKFGNLKAGGFATVCGDVLKPTDKGRIMVNVMQD